jgi:transglutaminase-like putative cysteine protease
VLAGALLAAQARADQTLHERIDNVDPDEAVVALAQHEADPSAIVYDGEVLPAPERSGAQNAPAMTSAPGDGLGAELPGRRSPTFKPDRMTDLEGSLEYYEAFKPSIAPFKRVSSLDAVFLDRDGKTPVLGVHDPQRRRVPIESANAKPPDPRPRDRFFGEVTLDFSQGRVVPLPSVSPESRISSLRTEPATQIAIERDGADNFFAVLAGPPPKTAVFVSFLTDAPRSYFGAELPHGKASALAGEVPELDPTIRKRALGFAATLGITPASDVADALSALTAHFRAFEESSEPPPDTGDIYLDLARAKKGICRHRTYAFVVTAHALGIPARFVQNEAHSWAEVKLPRIGFMRVDLGGSAHGLTAHGAQDRPQYHPAEPDPLPRPATYERSYSLAGRDVQGLRQPGDKELQGRWVAPSTQTSTAAQAKPGEQASFMRPRGSNAAQSLGGRAPLALSLAERHHSVLRGNELRVAGHVQNAAGQGVSGLRIEVSLAMDGRRERMLLGVTVSGEQGAFDAGFGVPPDLAVGDYRLVVVTPGNAEYLPAIAE